MTLRRLTRSLTTRRVFVSAVLFMLFLMGTGCKKKPPVAVPPQAEAPAPAASESSAASIAKPAEPPKTEPAPRGLPENTAPKPASKPARRAKPRPRPKTSETNTQPKDSQATAASGRGTNPTEGTATSLSEASLPNEQIGNKVIVRDGSTNPAPGQISTAVPDTQEATTRRHTESSLADAEKNIHALNRVLSEDEQAVLAQVRTFMQQSKSATTDGDTMRANNLAQKAQLLSAELVRKK